MCAFRSASSPPKIILQTLCKSGLLQAVMCSQGVLREKFEVSSPARAIDGKTS